MNSKRRTLALAVTMLLAVFVCQSTTASAASEGVSGMGMTRHQGQGIDDSDPSGDNAEADDPGEKPDDSAGHEDGEEGDEAGGHGPCTVAAGPVSVCLDELNN